MKLFSVAANTFDIYSETFIRNHAEKILPGSTALVALNPDAVFLPQFSSDDCFKFSPRNSLLPKKIDSLWRLVFGGSVFYPGSKDTNLLANFFKARGVKVLLAEYGQVGCAVERACQQSGVGLYVHFHGYDASQLLIHRHVRQSYIRLFRSARGFIFPSNFLANQLCTVLSLERSNCIHVVPCCVRPEEFNASQSKDRKLLLAVGRFVPKKAPQNSILAFSKVLRHFPDLRLEMIGDGELLQTCKDLVQTLGIEGQVVFHGSKPHVFVKEKMERALLFLQHSVTAPSGDTEGLGVSLLEAMASGAVVVATRHNGFVETVVEGETGFLVAEHDIDAMAHCCQLLLQDEGLLISMRQKARQRVEEKFTVGQQVASLKAIMGLKDE